MPRAVNTALEGRAEIVSLHVGDSEDGTSTPRAGPATARVAAQISRWWRFLRAVTMSKQKEKAKRARRCL
jgi:hypothetical protein